jgi:hypothetical protein
MRKYLSVLLIIGLLLSQTTIPARATPTITPTPTAYGASTATPTPTATATPRPMVEETASAMMVEARSTVSDTLGLDNIAPYDWRSSGRSFNFPNIFDRIIAPYTGQIFSYMLALMEIVNTNNAVVIIFILSLSITILMIVIKLVSGGALSGWQSTDIKKSLDNPYRALDKNRSGRGRK